IVFQLWRGKDSRRRRRQLEQRQIGIQPLQFREELGWNEAPQLTTGWHGADVAGLVAVDRAERAVVGAVEHRDLVGRSAVIDDRWTRMEYVAMDRRTNVDQR